MPSHSKGSLVWENYHQKAIKNYQGNKNAMYIVSMQKKQSL